MAELVGLTLLIILCQNDPDNADDNGGQSVDHAAGEESGNGLVLTAELAEEAAHAVCDHIGRVDVLDFSGPAFKPEQEGADGKIQDHLDGLDGESSVAVHGVVDAVLEYRALTATV